MQALLTAKIRCEQGQGVSPNGTGAYNRGGGSAGERGGGGGGGGANVMSMDNNNDYGF